MKKVIPFFLSAILCILVISAIHYRELVGYGIAQLKGQLHIVMNAVPVEEVIANPATTDSIKKKLLLIGEIKKFAIDSLGLKNSKNYTTYFDQHEKPVLWVLTACKPFSMEAYEWHFPFLGNVSYKGFFEREKGMPEDSLLRNRGYDTEYAPTGGWSTLGWFKDPILSNMLHKNEGRLAELIIHELTHATVYLPGSVDYNENLATFVGEQGAIRFLKSKYGTDSLPLKNYLAIQEDENIFGEYMVAACKQLDSLYRRMPKVLSDSERQQMKYAKISSIFSGLQQLPLHHPERYQFLIQENPPPNNAWFMAYKRYRNKQNDFHLLLDHSRGDLRLFINAIKEKAN